MKTMTALLFSFFCCLSLQSEILMNSPQQKEVEKMMTTGASPNETSHLSGIAAPAAANHFHPDSSLCEIARHSQITAYNTKQTPLSETDMDDWGLIMLTVVSLLVSIASAYWAWIAAKATSQTVRAVERETEEFKKRQINEKFQEKIFKDLIRHLYRNKVCICAIRQRLEGKNSGYETHYPSEEHLLKLQVLPEDLRLDRFDNTPEFYDKLHKMELYFRNFNIEIEVSLEHLKTQALSPEIKKRDLETLEFKSGFLTEEIFLLMNTLQIHTTQEEIRELLIEESKDKQKNATGDTAPVKIIERNSTRAGIMYYDSVLQLTPYLDEDIRREYGKISLIAFDPEQNKQ